jgi:Cytochrome c oxidase assembly factor 3
VKRISGGADSPALTRMDETRKKNLRMALILAAIALGIFLYTVATSRI